VIAVSDPICAGLVAVTVTPGSTPPCASFTSPLMLPVELAPPPWANADVAKAMVATTAQTTLNKRFISLTSNTEGTGPQMTQMTPINSEEEL
jgi:hypothetical protein